jgi:hypothetical protein
VEGLIPSGYLLPRLFCLKGSLLMMMVMLCPDVRLPLVCVSAAGAAAKDEQGEAATESEWAARGDQDAEISPDNALASPRGEGAETSIQIDTGFSLPAAARRGGRTRGKADNDQHHHAAPNGPGCPGRLVTYPSGRCVV